MCVVARGRELGGGASSTMTSPANDHLCLIHAPCNMCAFHSFPSYMHLQCTCLTVLAPRQHAHTHTKKRCVYHLMPGSILAAGPVSVLESLEVSAVSCQRASAVWRIKSPACLYFSRPLLPWKQVPRISHFFIFLYTIHITPPTTTTSTSTLHAAAALLLPPPTTCRIVQSHTIPVYCSHFTMSKNTSFPTHIPLPTQKNLTMYTAEGLNPF